MAPFRPWCRIVTSALGWHQSSDQNRLMSAVSPFCAMLHFATILPLANVVAAISIGRDLVRFRLLSLEDLIVRIGDIMGNIFCRSSTYGLLYLMLIPAFAVLYWQFDDEFYHSTIEVEPATKQQRTELSLLIDTLIERQFSDYVSLVFREQDFDDFANSYTERLNGEQLGQSARLKVSRVMWSGISAGMHRSTVAIDLCNDRTESCISWMTTATIDMSSMRIRTQRAMASGALQPDATRSSLLISFDLPGGRSQSVPVFLPPCEEPDCLPLSSSTNYDRNQVAHDSLPRPTSSQAKRYIELYIGILNAEAGYGYGIQDSFLRMLYFSSVTITTLGYGDIVPISIRTRLLVAFQSVFGVVLIGLFLLFLNRKEDHRDATAS